MKKILSFVVLFSLIFSINIFAQEAEKIDAETGKIIQEGDKLLKSGNYQGALNKYNEALKSSDNYQIYYQIGVANVKLKKIPEAEKALKTSIEKNPQNASTYDLLGRIEYATKNYEGAIEYLTKYMEMVEKDSKKRKAAEIVSKSYYTMGSKAKSDGDFNKAVELLQKSVDINNYDLAFFRLAEVQYELGNYDQAIENADKALNNRKTVAKGGPLYFKGMSFKKKGDLEKAKEQFELGKKDKDYGALCQHELEQMN